nr:MAG TPA: hypothetical protein [Caudoviricetes sp.]
MIKSEFEVEQNDLWVKFPKAPPIKLRNTL